MARVRPVNGSEPTPVPNKVKINPGVASVIKKDAAFVTERMDGLACVKTDNDTGTLIVGDPSAGVNRIVPV